METICDKCGQSVDTVVVDRSDYERMQQRLAWLESLEAAGVDNWQGYSHAALIFRESYPEYVD